MKTSSKFRSSITGVLILTAVYLFIYQLWYSGTPLGLEPAPGGQQILLTADKMYQDESFDEPFYRAPLYPYLISIARRINVLDLPVPLVARGMNSFFVLVTTFFTGSLAWLIWKRRYAVWFAGVAVGCNPVILYFAGDPQDITIATSCLTIACWAAYRSYQSRRFRWGLYLIGSLTLGAGMAMRPHLLLVGILWPVVLGLIATRNQSTRKPIYIGLAIAIGLVGPVFSLVGVGLANKAVSGEFRMTPWGGAYLLWAGNGELNNGRYYKQTVHVDSEDGKYQNPTKLESIYYYVDETREEPPHEISEMNDYFIDETIDLILDDPGAWIGLMFRKLHSLLHNYEQYDNKTYSLQKYDSPILRFNPIGWGLLLLAAATGACILYTDRKSTFWGLLIVIGLYSIMVLSTFTANRYRVPLIPLLALIGAGLPKVFFRQDRVSKRQKYIMIYLAGVVVTISFVPFFGIAAKDTYLADYTLMANTAHRRGFHKEAVDWTGQALAVDPNLDDIREVRINSIFMTWYGYAKNWVGTYYAEMFLEEIEEFNRETSEITYIQGVYLWKLGKAEEACRFWKQALATFENEDAAFALVWNCELSEDEMNQLPEQSRLKAKAIKNTELGFKESPDGDPYTEASIRELRRFYLFAFEPFLVD